MKYSTPTNFLKIFDQNPAFLFLLDKKTCFCHGILGFRDIGLALTPSPWRLADPWSRGSAATASINPHLSIALLSSNTLFFGLHFAFTYFPCRITNVTGDQNSLIAKVAGQCFYHQLRQIRSVCQSLDTDSAAHRFVLSSPVEYIDYCCSLLVGSVTDKLQRVMNAAARVITNTGKFERGLSHSLHYKLHWLDVPERIQFRVATTVNRCLHNMAPRYLSEMCMPIATSACRQGLQSVTTSNLVIPRVRRVTYGSCAFSVAGLVCWNGLPDYLKSPDLSFDCFKRQLKTFLFCAY